MSHFAITVIGRDRPGIVAETTEVLYHLGCNIADSSCSILGGQLAMILLVSHADYNQGEELQPAFANLEKQGLSVFIRTLKPGGEQRPRHHGQLCQLSVYGSDKPGIVYRVAAALAQRHINIEDFTTQLVGSEKRPVYVFICECALPPEVSQEDLEGCLHQLRQELEVDITLQGITPVEL